MNPFRKNLNCVAWLRILFALLFCLPIITPYWKKFGLDLLDIFWLQAIFSLSVVVFEIPTGYLGDKLGRKKTLLLACAIAATGWVFYAWARVYWQFICAEVYLGLAFGLLSGTDTALVYESLEQLSETDTFTRVEGRQYAGNHLAEAAAAVVGGLMAGFLPLEITFVASGLAAAGAFVVCLGITEPAREIMIHPRGNWYALFKIARFVFVKSRLVRWVVPLMAACSLSTMLGVYLYQPLWQENRIPIWLFGLLWGALSLPTSLASHYAHRWEEKLGKIGMLWLLPVPALAGYLLLALGPGCWALGGAYAVNLMRGANLPVLSKYIHAETFSDKRATVMSIQSWLFRLAYFVLGPGLGWIGKHHGLQSAFLVSAGLVLVLMALFLPPVVRQVRLESAPGVEKRII